MRAYLSVLCFAKFIVFSARERVTDSSAQRKIADLMAVEPTLKGGREDTVVDSRHDRWPQ